MKKYIYYLGIVAIALIGATSCQMQEEMWGNQTGVEQVGVLQLKVEATAPASLTTKAEASTTTNSVDTQDFAVVVKGKEGTDVKDVVRFFEKYADLPEKISLPIGEYEVSSHTPGELKKTLNYPYFAGEKELTITEGTENSTTVMCKMKNSRIQMNYSDDFKKSFTKWSIMITDKSNQALLYDETNMNPDAVYWFFDEETPSVTVHISATTQEGNTVTSEQTFVKDDASEKYTDVDTEFFTGGDALIIDMKPTEATTGKIGIEIKVSIVFENHDTPVRIDVGDKEIDTPADPETPTNPETPETGDLSVVLPADFTLTKVAENVYVPSEANAVITAKNGIQSMIVQISTTSGDFENALQSLEAIDQPICFLKGEEMVGNTALAQLEKVGVTLNGPQAGDTSYTFPIHNFFEFLILFSGTHRFKITCTDMVGNTNTKTLTITIE